jgi:hypothetical protein
MSGETEKQVSGWTVDTLHEHTLILVRGVERQIQGKERALKDKIIYVEKLSNAALTAANIAIDKSEKAVEKRFDGVNEFRKSLADQTAEFVRKSEIEIRFNAVSSEVAVMRTRIDTEAGKDAGKQNFVTTGIAVASIISVIAMGFYATQHSSSSTGTTIEANSKRMDDIIARFDALSNRLNNVDKK